MRGLRQQAEWKQGGLCTRVGLCLLAIKMGIQGILQTTPWTRMYAMPKVQESRKSRKLKVEKKGTCETSFICLGATFGGDFANSLRRLKPNAGSPS